MVFLAAFRKGSDKHGATKATLKPAQKANNGYPNAQFLPRKPRNFFWRCSRYTTFFLMWCAGIWMPIFTYLTTTPPKYTSHMALILPGSGASASVNLESIGQASSYASSAFASDSVSPTQTYKRLITANRIRLAAARSLNLPVIDLPAPSIDLVDQTGLIRVQMTGHSATEAQLRAEAILEAFQSELTLLRNDELSMREQSAVSAIEEYRTSVAATRADIGRLQQETGFLSKDQFSAQVSDNDALRVLTENAQARLIEKTAYVQALEATLGLSAKTAAKVLNLYSDNGYLTFSKDASNKAAQLAETRSEYGNQHPRVVEALAQYTLAQDSLVSIAVVRTGLSVSEIENLEMSQKGNRTDLLADLVRSEAARLGASAEYETLNARCEEERQKLEEIAPMAAQLEDLQRDFRVSEAVFTSAIARGQSSKVDVYASYPLVQVLEAPSLPLKPSSPRRLVTIALGVAATVCVIISLILGWARFGMINWLIARREERRV
ncbi:hypothetical protein EBB79_05940 [Parasedimentitalea marina]|uniref:Polysaccharide chain length determinant N-terminal domain-containing protein n=2 Tax=Parasedimentitalea marina TaxID=2483033 RepID=A0A3T0N0C2_9RHOB|nr:hypothetical protein EBB79_05940 [Parasedimentitalea marina]